MSTQELHQANCFGCKNPKANVVEAVKQYTKNGRLCLVGKCETCGKRVSRFIADPDKPALSAEEKKTNEKKRREEKKREREANPEVKSAVKKAKKRRVLIGDLEVTISVAEVTGENAPKRRKLTAKEKREKQIIELEVKNRELEKHLKDILDRMDEEASGSEEEYGEKEEEISEEISSSSSSPRE